jgi:two-component system, chemotaxis family, chemotaxis protein CheY
VAKTILAVDDSPVIRQVEQSVLTGAGYQVMVASSGSEALGKLVVATVNLILTDLNMPGMDGVELIKQVRAHAKHRLTPIVMITTESKDSKKQEGKAAGATAWMVKPFTPDQLLGVVKRIVG